METYYRTFPIKLVMPFLWQRRRDGGLKYLGGSVDLFGMAPSVGDKIGSEGLHSTVQKVMDLQKATQQ